MYGLSGTHITKEYSNIRVQFLPPNTTSKVQPLDKWIIRVCKLQYHTLITKKFLRAVDTEDDVKKIMAALDFIITYKNIVVAWNYVSDSLKNGSIKQASSSVSQSHHSLNKKSGKCTESS